jgi:hypothetical protein
MNASTSEIINGSGKSCPCVPIYHLKSPAIMQIIVGFGGDINENKSEITGIRDYISNSVTRSGVREAQKNLSG